MRLRLANGLLVVAAVLLLVGMAGIVLGSDLRSWDELGKALRWYLSAIWARGLSLLPLLALGLGLGIWLLVVASRNRAAFRAEVRRTGRAISPERRLARARRRLEPALLASRHSAAAALDALLGSLVDLEARAIEIVRGDLVFAVAAVLDDGSHPLSSLTEAQLRAVREQAELVTGPGGDGELELRSPGRADRIRVRSGMEAGPALRLELAGADEGKPRRGPVPVLVRMSGAGAFRHKTGEVTASFAEPDETTDSNSGLLLGLDPSAEHEIAPIVPTAERRPIRGREAWLRLWVSLVVLLAVLALAAPAIAWGGRRLVTGESTAPWREINLIISSTPSGARVRLGGELHGLTPLRLREPCRGRRLQVIVEARGHLVWQWNGICPDGPELHLDAELAPAR